MVNMEIPCKRLRLFLDKEPIIMAVYLDITEEHKTHLYAYAMNFISIHFP